MMNNDFLAELKALPQWVAFRKVWNEKRGRYSKPPINIHTGKGNDWNTPEAWGTYQEAFNYAILHDGLIASLPDLNKGGIGFVFTENDHYAGIDLDDVINNDGTLIPEAADIVALMDSYTEYSLSGQGLHIIFTLSQPLDTLGFNLPHELNLGVASKMGIHDKNKFFTVSEKPYGTVKPIADRTEQCRQLCAKLSEQRAKRSTIADWVYTPSSPSPVDTPSTLWQRMFSSEKGSEIQALYEGNTEAYGGDHSRADMAILCYLAYWTDNNPQLMDAMFRQTKLFRPEKWDTKHYNSGETYGEHTIAEAIAINKSNTQKNTRQSTPTEQKAEQAETHTLLTYLKNSFARDVEAFSLHRERKTGYDNIDKFTSLYPGLYVLGAISSLGKTTFCHQMADQLARAGDYVLYFSLEQTELELASKGIARLTAQERYGYPVSSLEIRKGYFSDAVKHAINTYQTFAGHETIIECSFGTTITDITSKITDYITKTGRRPVVFVDYLQAIKQSDLRVDAKLAIDMHVEALKKLSADYSIVIFLISAFNRTNYLSIVDFESFKGSGGIEYTADVVYGLQLLAMNASIFNKQAETWLKRKFVMLAKEETPRKIELITLKNRFGKTSARFFFHYDPEHDLFIPDERDFAEIEAEMQERYQKFEAEALKEKEDNKKRGVVPDPTRNRPRNRKTGEY